MTPPRGMNTINSLIKKITMSKEKEKKEIIRRLNILRGQIEGIGKMIEKNKDCLEIISQIKAVKNGFNCIGESFIKEYINECVTEDKEEDLLKENFNKALRLLSN